MAKDYDHKKYGSVMKGRSAEQLSNWQKDFGSKSSKSHALKAKVGGEIHRKSVTSTHNLESRRSRKTAEVMTKNWGK